ncbi:hypothetical protein WEN_02465 [Mycoplasma wenyonii str. Massachusetts]|uniref:Uncharacterized protein n=1 Tax=Mycoplasma wenyonii (strain Massachusetts) TaxID=1197325 RepID=I6ZJB9_MYCWM|nr:hypothetical protein [Mycoplasma wenyonii]AFN65280.1 hypothetical protein WEN_02465 [Mycoplasma wenyonii str. Massachusetts]
MREGAASQTRNMSYSYGYVVRMEGSEYARQEKRTIENETFDIKGTLDGKLTLIETQLGPRGEGDKSRLAGKSRIKPVIGGFTKKKFFLIGVGKNNQVEFEALVSIVDGSQGVNWPCLKDVLKVQLKNNTQDVQKLRDKFGQTGLFWPNNNNGRLSLGGQIAFGNCAKEFYKDKNKETSSNFVVVEKLQKEDKQIGLQELKIDGGMSIAIAVGMKKKNGSRGQEEEIIAPGVLVKEKFTNGRTLWAGLQGDGVVVKVPQQTRTKKIGQGTIVLHDWRSADTENSTSSLYKNNSEETKDGFAKKITLSGDKRRYFLWDPSYTNIKNGKLITKDGEKIPWATDIQIPFNSSLIK